MKVRFKFVGVLLLFVLLTLTSALGLIGMCPFKTGPLNAQSIQSAEVWHPVPAHREDRGKIKVVWLAGSPYDMGYQHGQLLHPEIASIDPAIIHALNVAGRGFGLSQLARRRSSDDVVEECQGMTDAVADIGLTHEACLVLAFGDVFQELFGYLLPNLLFNDGCSQVVAAGLATPDGHLYHGGSLDNRKRPIQYWIENSTVFVRQPRNGIPHVSIVVPGVIWPNAGLNDAGISVGLNTAHPNDPDDLDFDQGGSNVQLMRQVLQQAHSFEEAQDILETHERFIANLIMVADGHEKRAGVFELLGKEFAVRELSDDGILYVSNHFKSGELVGKDKQPISQSSRRRYDRYHQLLDPDGASSYFGQIDVPTLVKILRDRTNPDTGEVSPLDLFDDNASPGGNGSMRQTIFDPERKLFWIAAGEPPVPENPFVCFSLDELLGHANATVCPQPEIR